MLDRLRKRLYQAVQAANPKELIVRKAKISVAINMYRMLVGCFRHYSLPRVWTNMAMGRHGKDTKLRDQILKSEARQQVNNAVGNSLKLNALGVNGGLIRFAPIDSAAIEISHGWYGSSYPWGDVPWWKRKDARGLDLALWHADELCGLCYATPRRSRLRIKVILLEGQPNTNHPLKGLVARLMFLAVGVYARMLGCEVIQIESPEPGVVSYYQRLGFQFDADGCLVISAGRS
ncbi:N-acetyltransferase [Pseudomonas sp. PS02290]|uniref:N-acetyltransferase n=1 Tax=Pseudomonas sp. PS02290 TaxID=2991430 RepID=UPI00249CE54D|nr:N-acetyltransferase [Pseudomonas sp. PS02290]